MIKKGIPMYILPIETSCDMCKHTMVSINVKPCNSCNQDHNMRDGSKFEIQPERKIEICGTNQRVEHLEFMVLQLQKKLEELGLGQKNMNFGVITSKENKMSKLRIYILTIKYFFQGDDWQFAKEYATSLVKGFKKQSKKED